MFVIPWPACRMLRCASVSLRFDSIMTILSKRDFGLRIQLVGAAIRRARDLRGLATGALFFTFTNCRGFRMTNNGGQ